MISNVQRHVFVLQNTDRQSPQPNMNDNKLQYYIQIFLKSLKVEFYTMKMILFTTRSAYTRTSPVRHFVCQNVDRRNELPKKAELVDMHCSEVRKQVYICVHF